MKRKICLVIADVCGPNRDESRAFGWKLARLLACDGAQVQVLDGGSAPQADDRKGFDGDCRHLDDFTLPADMMPAYRHHWHLWASDRIHLALKDLHDRHRFDLILFAGSHGLAFRSLQARRTAGAFEGVPIGVILDNPLAWQRHQERRWMAHWDELEADFAEKYVYERADKAWLRDGGQAPFLAGIGWRRDQWEMWPGEDKPLPDLGALVGKVVPSPAEAWPLVTIGIPFYNLGAYLPDTLASLVAQTYPNLEVIVVNDGSTDPESVRVFAEQKVLYPQFQFITQENAGPGAARNRALFIGKGEYFVPVDADNIAASHMVERLVKGMQANPELAVLTSYFVAFREVADLRYQRFVFAARPSGGPLVMGAVQNIFGDTNAIYRMRDFRAVGGYEVDEPGTNHEDWEAFVKLIKSGYQLDVLPEVLFFYRFRAQSFSRTSNYYLNQRRVLRQYFHLGGLPLDEQTALWTAFLSLKERQERMEESKLFQRVYVPLRRLNERLQKYRRLHGFIKRIVVGLSKGSG